MAIQAAPTTSGSANMSTLSDWAGPYVTNMLGKGQALSDTPYQTYGGPLTAGASGLQNKVFSGLGSLSMPSNLGQSFSSTGAYQVPQYGANGMTMETGTGGADGLTMGAGGAGVAGADTTGTAGAPAPNVANQYMNPYLQSVLNPQLDELRRQSQITQMGNNAKMSQAGAFGGGRQAIMDAETQRNLMQEQNKTVGQGYANAYDKAMGQFNTEQGQAKTLVDLMAQQGQTERGIEAEGVAADLNEFNAQRDYPQKQVSYLNSLIQGLPISTVSNVPQAQTGTQQFTGNLADVTQLLKDLKVIT